MKIVIAGEAPLTEYLIPLCESAGHTVQAYYVETLADAAVAHHLAEDASESDLALECHNETKAGKQRVIQLLDNAKAIYACALSCSTTEAASWSSRPERVVGWGALPPLETGGIMELAAGLQSSPEAIEAARAFWQSLGLQPVTVADSAGLVRARVVCALVNEAANALADGIATPADIDTAMRLGANYPRGPLAWGDLIGLDTVLGVMRGLQDEFGEDRYRPTPLLVKHVQAKRLGQKTKRGFFEYQ
jgi:3-hydroxybutyryl-CoA dehydrogenase